jgi:hypothetical protein
MNGGLGGDGWMDEWMDMEEWLEGWLVGGGWMDGWKKVSHILPVMKSCYELANFISRTKIITVFSGR